MNQNQDWVEQISADRARLRELNEWISNADVLGLSDKEVNVLVDEANEIEVGLESWSDYLADMEYLGRHDPDYFYDGP